MKAVSGFTLIELLISMSLLSMVILIGSSSYGLFSQRWDGQLGRFDSLLQRTKSIMLVQDVLDSLLPYVAHDDQGSPFIYFEGNRNGFVAVSSRSIRSEGDFAVARLSAVQNKDLSFDILYEEWAMDKSLLVSTDQFLEFSKPITLFKSVTAPIFEYYGWNDIRQKQSEDDIVPLPEWSSSYNGLQAWFAPLKARLSFANEVGSFQVESSLAVEKRGLLSRYGKKSYHVTPQGYRDKHQAPIDNGADGDDCDC